MNRKEALLKKKKKLEKDYAVILERAKKFDLIHVWSFFFLVFGVGPVVLIFLSHYSLGTVLPIILSDNCHIIVLVFIFLMCSLFYGKKKGAEEYDKLFSKRRRINSITFVVR